MNIPVDLRAAIEFVVVVRGKAAGDKGGYDDAEGGVEGEGEEDFVGVEGEGGEVEVVGDGFDGVG